MDTGIRSQDQIRFADSYRSIRLFERLHFASGNQTKIDLMVELYRNHPTPLMTKSLASSSNANIRTLKSAITTLIAQDLVTESQNHDRRVKLYRLTKQGLRLMQQYHAFVQSVYANALPLGGG